MTKTFEHMDAASRGATASCEKCGDCPSGGGGGEGSLAPRILVGMDSYWVAVVWSLLPTVVVSIVFFLVMRGVIRMDRVERREYAKFEAEERARRGLPPVAASTSSSASSD
ncbi:hypothetical protein ACWPKO_27100 (plasmid) [Coraliomargarita sp. W4R53]